MTESISIKRLRKVIDSYGADPDRWPADERSRLIQLADNHLQSRRLLENARRLDLLLDQHAIAPPPDRLFKRALSTLPQSDFLDQVLLWVWPGRWTSIWQPAVAITLPLILGILLGSLLSVQETSEFADVESLYIMGMYSPQGSE